MPRQVEIIVFEEDDAVTNVFPAGELDDLADEFLAAIVAGVRFACQENLHGPVRVIEEAQQSLRVGEEQRGALIGGEAAREPNGQRVRVQNFSRLPDFILAHTALFIMLL
jgi:hypothetical protein